MCGIFGIAVTSDAHLKKQEASQAIKNLFLLSESRGKEAAGLCVRSGNRMQVLKQPNSASTMLKSHEYRRFLSDVFPAITVNLPTFSCIGHSRLMTDGHKSSYKNNQPVITQAMVGVHNGIVCNTETLWQENKDLDRESELDSEILFKIIEKNYRNSETYGVRGGPWWAW